MPWWTCDVASKRAQPSPTDAHVPLHHHGQLLLIRPYPVSRHHLSLILLNTLRSRQVANISAHGRPCFLLCCRDVFDTAGPVHAAGLKEWWDRARLHPDGPRYPVDSVCEHINRGVNLALDNRWLSDKGRVNPVILGLDPFGPEGHPTFCEAANPDGGNELVLGAVLDFYAALAAEGPGSTAVGKARAESKILSGADPDQFYGLLAWDLACTLAVRKAPEAFLELCRGSHAVDPTTTTAVPQSVLLDRVVGHVLDVSDRHPNVPLIVGLQEPPPDLLTLTATRPDGVEVHYSPTGKPSTAVLYRHCTLVADLTADPTHDFAAVWRDYLADKVPPALAGKAATTVERVSVTVFGLPSGGRVAVLNAHVSSFKAEVGVLGQFLGFAAGHVEATLGIPAILVGDTNIDSPWDKGCRTVDAQMAALAACPVGRLPEAAAAAVRRFEAGLTQTNPAVTVHPPLGSITTMKRRTHFQAQAAKAGEFVVSHKDVVLLPEGYRAVDTQLGVMGEGEEGVQSNVELLLPSAAWPADHYAVLVVSDPVE